MSFDPMATLDTAGRSVTIEASEDAMILFLARAVEDFNRGKSRRMS